MLCSLVALGSAQELDKRFPEYRRPVIKFFPLPMVDPFQYTLHLGLEVPMGLQNSLQLEGGWVFGHLGEDLGTGVQADEFHQTGLKRASSGESTSSLTNRRSVRFILSRRDT